MPVLETIERIRVTTYSAFSALAVSEAAFVARTADPFNVDNTCINPAGHDYTASCGEVVCVHCTRIAWR